MRDVYRVCIGKFGPTIFIVLLKFIFRLSKNEAGSLDRGNYMTELCGKVDSVLIGLEEELYRNVSVLWYLDSFTPGFLGVDVVMTYYHGGDSIEVVIGKFSIDAKALCSVIKCVARTLEIRKPVFGTLEIGMETWILETGVFRCRISKFDGNNKQYRKRAPSSDAEGL